jgi:hypothetical protein
MKEGDLLRLSQRLCMPKFYVKPQSGYLRRLTVSQLRGLFEPDDLLAYSSLDRKSRILTLSSITLRSLILTLKFC